MRYTRTHEWVDLHEGVATTGLCDAAIAGIGNVTSMQLPEEGTDIIIGEEVGLLESNKSAIELYAPLSGRVLERAADIKDLKWLYRIKISDKAEYDSLLTKEQYEKEIFGET